MNNNINKIFVITKNNKRFNDTSDVYSDYNLELIKCPIIKNKLPVSKLNNELCHSDIANNWYTHYDLWKNIVDNNIRISLVLEDNTYPVLDFNKKLVNVLDNLPKKWDMIYCGCLGTCEMNSVIDELLSTSIMSKNKCVYINGKLKKDLIKPSFPIGTYAYLISLKGAKKLLNNKHLKTVHYRLDHTIANNILPDSTFQIYTTMPPLIYRDISNDNYIHQIIKYPTDKLKLSSQITLYDVLNYEPFYYKSLDIKITLFMLTLFVIALFIGYFSSMTVKQYFGIALLVYAIIDTMYAGPENHRLKSYILTLLYSGLMMFVGYKLKNFQ
jgi:GR25 family glycosyltransferase involved in LPS biosynthesis